VTERHDVIIIGTGAGGGTLAHTIAPPGKRILLLERGDYLPREMANWDPGPVFVDGKYISPDTWYDADGKPFQPQVHCFVGGATKMYGAALYRLRPADFGEIAHVDGVSPAWPLGYDDFEPWYTKAEWLYQIRGAHGEDPPRATAPAPTPGRRCLMSPGSSNCPTTSPRPAPSPSTPRGEREVYAASIVVLSADSARILLASASGAHPAGLANSSGQVGRNYMFHNSKAVIALCEEPNGKNFYASLSVPVAGVAHQAGTCRFGTDPATSVLDIDCKAHDLDNLYVVDTSFFPSIGAVNPALTAMANAIRVGEHLLQRLR
jgi:choline dehydrogenase-like flavoprotein